MQKLSPHPCSKCPLPAQGKPSMPFALQSQSNGTKAMAGLRCVATWQMSPRGKTWGSTQARDLGSQVSSTPGSMVKGGLSVILRCPGGEVPVPVPVILISVCPSVNHQTCPYSHSAQSFRWARGSQFTSSLSHFGAGFSVKGLTDKGPSFQELLEVHAL